MAMIHRATRLQIGDAVAIKIKLDRVTLNQTR
jgi:hypothetical protein